MAPSDSRNEPAMSQSLRSTPSGLRQEGSSEHIQPSEDLSKNLHRRRLHRQSHPEGQHVQHHPSLLPKPAGQSIYMGSYSHSPRRSRISLDKSKSPGTSTPTSPGIDMSQGHLQSLLQDINLDVETYGVEELRDGFFDASFFKPPKSSQYVHSGRREDAHSFSSRKPKPKLLQNIILEQWHSMKTISISLTTTRAGIKLTKSFLAFLTAYVLCLIPAVEVWLGRYNYLIVLSAVFNHPGRTVGAQVDGFILTCLGSAIGLGWGSFALWLSDSTAAARGGYGGILAVFLVFFMAFIGAMRAYYIRMYQAVLCAGIAIIFVCLPDTSEQVNWRKLRDYAIPWVFGQIISLIICCSVFPDAGARPLAVSMHDAFRIMHEGLMFPHTDTTGLHQRLSWTFVQASQAYRDLTLDVSVTRFRPVDVMLLRNLFQGVIRSLLALRMDRRVFDETESTTVEQGDHSPSTNIADSNVTTAHSHQEVVIEIDKRPSLSRTTTEEKAVRLVTSKLSKPSSELLACMRTSLSRCDAVLMDMSGYRQYLGPPESVSTDVLGALTRIRKVMINYDEAEQTLMNHPELPPSYSNHPEVVEIFLFVHPVRQAATSVENLLIKVMEMQQRRPGWKLYLPSYPLSKALQRTNAQVRHDRGGVTAGFYFRSQAQLARTMKGMASIFKPLPRESDPSKQKMGLTRARTLGKYEEEEEDATDPTKTSRDRRLRYRVWMVLHRLQDFETRFALKVAVVTGLLSIPAWLSESRIWWSKNESYWAVITVWIMMHPRVGGNVQDLLTRAFCAALGAIWGGISYLACGGNPYGMAVFATLYMLPMIYRYTQSSHPRSGIMGCVSFIVVSLSAQTNAGPSSSAVQIAWTRGLAFIVGVIAAVIVNWILWPFVARHELRKALSAMMVYSGIIYRGIVAQYVYYEDGSEPGKAEIERSEMLEGRLREGFVRIRQLMALTRHEIRLRGPFNHLPYAALIDASERFFEYLVSLRQSSLFFHPHYMSDNEQAAESLFAFRRDAVAAILMNLYILAGALRGNRKVPRYLPSAAAARKRLLDQMASIEALQLGTNEPGKEIDAKQSEGRRWAQIYSYSYSQSLTGCVKQLEQLQKYTKEIVGEQGFDPIDMSEYEDHSQTQGRRSGVSDL